MLNSGKKISASRYKKYKYSNSSERNKKPYPPLQVKWSVPKNGRLKTVAIMTWLTVAKYLSHT